MACNGQLGCVVPSEPETSIRELHVIIFDHLILKSRVSLAALSPSSGASSMTMRALAPANPLPPALKSRQSGDIGKIRGKALWNEPYVPDYTRASS